MLLDEFDKTYMRNLRAFLLKEREARKTIYPRGPEIFAALDLTPLEDVRVVIIGQDPYHGPNQAHGLCFSVQPGVEEPPSLLNIFQEINSDMSDPSVPGGRADGHLQPGHGCLTSWARQGVLLLNAVLTVERGRAGSHQGRGWETFTDRIVEILNAAVRRARVHAVGQLRAEKRRDRRPNAPLRAVVTAPVAVVGASRLLRLPALLRKRTSYLVAHGKAPIDWFAVE